MTTNSIDPQSPSEKSHLLYGSAIMIGMRWTMRVAGLVSTLVLVRLLTPEDFGVVAMAMVIFGFIEVFTYTSVDLALIRDQAASRAHYDTAWTLEILQSTALTVALIVVAPYATTYFKDERVLGVIHALALRAFVGGFENIGVVAFRRDLEFKKEYWFGVTKKLATVGLTISAAFLLRSYWALVIGLVGGRVLDVLISYVRHPYRPRLNLSKTRELWNFSRWILLGRIGDTLSRKLDEFIVGGQLGTTAMGNYFVASDVATAPSDEIVGPMSRGVYPVYSRLLAERFRLTESFLLVLGSTAFMCIPIGLGLSAVAPHFVPIVLGDKWVEVVPLIELLGVVGAALALTTTFEPLLVVSGRGWAFASYQWVQLALMVPALYVGAEYGVVGIAAAKAVVVLGLFAVLFVVISRIVAIPARSLALSIAPALISGIVMYAGVRATATLFDSIEWYTLATLVAIGGTLFVLTSIVFWHLRGKPMGPERQVLKRIARAWKEFRARPSSTV